jgi:NAD(P)-dependent dehydrogenase (short-subunit alcohol dehydrogenase family)
MKKLQGAIALLTGGASANPLDRVGTPAEVAKAVLFPASVDSSYVNGAELFVDGGITQI